MKYDRRKEMGVVEEQPQSMLNCRLRWVQATFKAGIDKSRRRQWREPWYTTLDGEQLKKTIYRRRSLIVELVKGASIVLSEIFTQERLVAIAKGRCCHMSRSSDNDDAP
jgi:hypothetical protein